MKPSPTLLAASLLLASVPALAQTGGAPASPPSPRFVAARQLYASGDYPGARSAFETLVEAEPENGAAWYFLGLSLHAAGELEEALRVHEKAAAFPEVRANASYNVACANARLGRVDAAFEWLAKARAAGFANLSQVVTDPDLVSLRSDPRLEPYLPPKARDRFLKRERRVLATFVGEAAGDQFGWIGRNTGDADGDGTNDVLLSAPTSAANGPGSGKIYVYSGRTGALLYSRAGQPGQQLGLGLGAAGDVNGDGYADSVAGAPSPNRGGDAVYVYSGKDGSVLLDVPAEQPGSNFGRKVGPAGDVDGDGHDDVIVGAPLFDSLGQDEGRAYVISGKDGEILLALDGEEDGDQFGSTVNGDAGSEGGLLVIGAENAGEKNRGRVYVFRYVDGDADLLFTIDSEPGGSSLGQMFVSVVGDVDGDGVRDVYASDWAHGAKGPQTGRIYVHSGATGERLHTLTGEAAGDGFGIGTAEAGDVDGDGCDDLLIGAWQSREGGPSAGKCYLYSGKTGALLDEYVCTSPGDTFGFDTTSMGDVDGDGIPDFLITSAWSNVVGPRSGRAFVIAGPSLRAAATR